MGVLLDCIRAIQQRASISGSLIQKIKSASPVGTRLTPPQNSKIDSKVGGRIDWGPIFTRDGEQYQSVNLQLNKDAENSSIKKMVEKNGTHKKYAEAWVPVSAPVVPTTKRDQSGKEVPLSEEEIKAATEAELEKRKDKMFEDLLRAVK